MGGKSWRTDQSGAGIAGPVRAVLLLYDSGCWLVLSLLGPKIIIVFYKDIVAETDGLHYTDRLSDKKKRAMMSKYRYPVRNRDFKT